MSHSESITVNRDGLFYVIPTVVRGRKMTNREAMDYAFTNRQWHGVFSSEAKADAYAQRRSRMSNPYSDMPRFGKVSH